MKNNFTVPQKQPIIVARKVPDTARFGRIETASGRLLGVSDKDVAGPGLVNAGCYVLPNDLLDSFMPVQLSH